MSSPVFSDAWFRIAPARVALAPGARVQKQLFRGKPWYVIHDTFTSRYFRVTPQAWAFIAGLDTSRTIEEAWLDFIARHPDDAPGQDEVVRVLSQLHLSNLLRPDDSPDNAAIWQRSQRQRQRELQGKLMSFLYVRVFLWDPDQWLERHLPLVRFLTHPALLVLWLAVVLYGGSVAFTHADDLFDHSQGLFSVANLPWLYLSMAMLKLLHEAAHAFTCKRYGGEVHAFGVMFLILTPLPYVDMASTWGFKNRLERVHVGLAGMLTELFCAAIAAVIWANTSAGLVNSLAYNAMVVGSVSSLVFNGNPLLRFDAYYILADLLDIPNLYQKAQQQWLYLMDRWLLGTRAAQSPAEDRREWWWFTGYGLGAFWYRLMVTFGIVLFVLDQWFAVGLAMVVVTLINLLVMPLRKLVNHLRGPRVAPNRGRAVLVVASLATLLVAGGATLPLPNSLVAPGVIEARETAVLHVPVEGRMVRLAAASGARLQSGDLIASLVNPDLEYDLTQAREELRAIDLQYRQSLTRTPGDTAPLLERQAVLNKQIAELEGQRRKLEIRAPAAGLWVAPELHHRQGAWLARGLKLGELVPDQRYRFVAVVRQERAGEMFKHALDHAALRLAGQSEVTLELSSGLSLIPYQRDRLSSSALGWMGGGEVAVRPGDQTGEATTETFYELRAELPAELPGAVRPLAGLSGVVRVPLPEQPLFVQAQQLVLQLFQKRYGL